MREAFIYDIIRTPVGRGDQTGSLYEVHPLDLLATCLHNLKKRNNLHPEKVVEVVIGCTTPIRDQGANIARAAVLRAGWPASVSGLQINKFESSGLEALRICQLKIAGGESALLVGGGIESMSRVAPASDQGALNLHPELFNRHYLLPPTLRADLLATTEGFSEEELEEYAEQAHKLAQQAKITRNFAPITVPIIDQSGLTVLRQDELAATHKTPPAPQKGDIAYDAIALQKSMILEKVGHLHRPLSSSKPADGAAVALIGGKTAGEAHQMTPKAKIRSYGYHAAAPTPGWSSIEAAVEMALAWAELNTGAIELWEVYDPFAAVGLYFKKKYAVAPECFNVTGGALALGAPTGAIGTILVANLLNELEKQDRSLGLVAIPTQSGMATALIIERLTTAI